MLKSIGMFCLSAMAASTWCADAANPEIVKDDQGREVRLIDRKPDGSRFEVRTWYAEGGGKIVTFIWFDAQGRPAQSVNSLGEIIFLGGQVQPGQALAAVLNNNHQQGAGKESLVLAEA